MKRKQKKAGISIAEMCVVLAVLAIAGAVVVSFTAMVSARSNASTTKLKAAEELDMSQAILESWVDRMLALDASITADNTGLTATVGTDTYRVMREEESLIAQLPGDMQLICPAEVLEGFRFEMLGRPNGNPLVFCTVQYTVNNPAGEDLVVEDTFTVLSRVGEVVSG